MDKYKLCICVSGGLDSYAAVRYAQHNYSKMKKLDFQKDVILLSVMDKDSPYVEKEWNSILEHYSGVEMPELETVELRGYGALALTDDHVILGRNAMIASIAVALAPEVWICGTAFEDNEGMWDKNRGFFLDMSLALSRACAYKRPHGYRQGMPGTIIRSPFQGPLLANDYSFPLWEKHDMIRYLEDLGYLDWRETVTCFHPTLPKCGSCVVCGKRYVYEKYAEILWGTRLNRIATLEDSYTEDPRKNVSLLDTFEKMKEADSKGDYARYHKARIEIYRKVLGGQDVLRDEQKGQSG